MKGSASIGKKMAMMSALSAMGMMAKPRGLGINNSPDKGHEMPVPQKERSNKTSGIPRRQNKRRKLVRSNPHLLRSKKFKNFKK